MDSVGVMNWGRVETKIVGETEVGPSKLSGRLPRKAGFQSSQSLKGRWVHRHPLIWVSVSRVCFPALEGTLTHASKGIKEQEPPWDSGSEVPTSANLPPSFFP